MHGATIHRLVSTATPVIGHWQLQTALAAHRRRALAC
jgi:hypothetical protein